MTYPPSSPGYPPAPQSGPQYGAPAQQPQFAKSADPGDSKLPEYLLGGVAAFGLITYLVSFALKSDAVGALFVLLALLAGLLAGVSLLPKQKNYAAVSAVIATLAFLLVLAIVVSVGGDAGWALYLTLALILFQAGCAITAVLFDAGVLTPPAPKPQFDQAPYGQYGGPSQYYGQQSQPQHGGQPYQQAPAQRPGYPSQYGSYSSGPTTGGFPSQGQQGQQGQQSGPPTPPTGFPTYGQPQQQSNASAPTSQVQAQQSPSQQSGPAPS